MGCSPACSSSSSSSPARRRASREAPRAAGSSRSRTPSPQPAPNAGAAVARKPEAPHIVTIAADGEYFVGPSKHTLMTLREDGNGAVLELYDATGRRVVVSDLDVRLRGLEARVSREFARRVP